jgi:hypothetical protein
MQYVSPFTYFIQHPMFLLLIVCLFFYQCYSSSIVARKIQGYGVQRFREFRLVSHPSPMVTISSLTILYSGCEVSWHNMTQNNSRVLVFPSQIQMDGLMIDFSPNSSRELTTVSVIAIGSGDGWRTVRKIGSLNVRWTGQGIRFLAGPVAFQKRIIVKYFPAWPWFISEFVPRILWAICCFGTGFCGIFKRPAAGKAFCICILCSFLIAAAVSACGYASLGLFREVFESVVNVVVYSTLAWTLVYAEAYFIDVFACLALLSLSGNIIVNCLIFDDADNLAEDPPVTSSCFIALGVIFISLRRCFYLFATNGVAADRDAADGTWSELAAAEPDAILSLDALCRETAALCPARPARQLNRQRVGGELRPSSGSATLSCSKVLSRVFHFDFGTFTFDADETDGPSAPGTADEDRPVASLDQLYSQALGVAPLLHAHCAAWAERSRGALDETAWSAVQPKINRHSFTSVASMWVVERRKSRHSPGPAQDAAASTPHGAPDLSEYLGAATRGSVCNGSESGEGLSDRVARVQGTAAAVPGTGTPASVPGTPEWWARQRCIKQPERAIEKAAACYGGDASRLVDICRARIVFKGVVDLCTCFKAVCDAPDVRVVRVKNSLAAAHDTRLAAGYRVGGPAPAMGGRASGTPAACNHPGVGRWITCAGYRVGGTAAGP